ncbi:MAG: bis-aminopropyl spermidine synthase family protein [Armatimonadetes bacterium]|nr:bis-aminopropyl spermidine synthase family protein [Armatimonadota bacterium]MDW8029645.1 bis-aminopropyl spermidine synthase family protein [Armatimonadota bacterium]
MEKSQAKEKLSSLVEATRKKAPIPFSPRDAERALSALLATDDLWEAVRLSHAPMRFLCAFWEQMIADGLLSATDGKLRFTDAGRSFVSALEIAPAREVVCDACEGRGVDFRKLFGESVERFFAICQNRPEAIQDYDQGYVTEATTLARIAFAWQRGDLEGKEIIVLGDDDLMSVAAALTGAPKRVLAIDIDERLVNFINEVAERESLASLKAVKHDLREPLPDDWLGAFDTFLCDPTESFVGFKAFVERGLLCLKGVGSAGYFGLTHVESSLDKWSRIQRFLLESGAVITDLRDDFSGYVNWGYIEEMRSWDWLPTKVVPKKVWYCSALFRIELLQKPKVENRRLEGDIFEDEEAATT